MLPTKAHMPEIDRLQRVALIAAPHQRPLVLVKDVEGLRRTLTNMQSSKSWRLTAPMRWAVRFIKNPAACFESNTPPSSIADPQRLMTEINNMRSSTSWRITAPLRLVKQLIVRH